MRRLDRPGIFKARPLSWAVRTAESGAVSISAEYLVLAQLDGTEWIDWSEAEEHTVFGDTYVVKRDGTVNTSGVEQLVAALGWNGDLRSVVGRPPQVVVQINVKDEEYQGKRRVPPTVREGLEAVRLSGLTNMLDRPAVARIAAEMGYDACARWVHRNRDLYARGVFHGFEAGDDGEGMRGTSTRRRRFTRGVRRPRSHLDSRDFGCGPGTGG